MSAVRQVGIKMVVDAQSVTTEMPRAAREFVNFGASAEQGAARATRSLAQVSMSVRDIVQGAAGLHIVSSAIEAVGNAITALPRNAFDYSKNLEVSQVGMAGILGSMTAINGQQLDYNRGLQLAVQYIQQLNDDALRTAATSQELVQVFQALLAPGLGAKMTLEEIRQLTVVGTNAVKSMGLDATQVVQELRDLVAGGIQPASSTFANALGLKDSDIAKAKASSEGLFKFLMDRMQGFKASSEAFSDTFKGKLDQIQEGATRVAAQGLEPLITASKAALGEISNLFVTIDENKNVTLNQGLVDGIKELAEMAVAGMGALRDFSVGVYEHREAVAALVAVYASARLGSFVADLAASTAAKLEAAQASRLAAVQAAAEAAGNVEVAVTSKQKLAAYMAELSAKAAQAQADVAAQAAQLATLNTTREAIVVARAEVVAKLDAVRATMAQAEALIAAARAAGAQSVALALVREGTQALTAAQARHALLMTELATLGKQQAGVQAAIAAATTAQTAAQNAAAASATQLAAAQGAASVAGRALGGVVGFLGGPIGIVTTAVTLGATAWALWGSKGADAEQRVRGAVARTTPEIIADLDKQISKLQQRNALAAAGLGDLAKQGSEATDRLAELQTQIDHLQAGRGPTGGQALPEEARVELLQKLLAQYGTLTGKIRSAEEAQAHLNTGAGKLGLTVQGAEQAWRKANDGVKTAIAIQQEYSDKLSASRSAWEQYRTALQQQGAQPEKLRQAQAEQDQVERQLAAERDKKIKDLGAGAATARAQGIDAEIAATKHGYKLLAAQTADSLAEVDALRRRGVIDESDALEQRTALQLADIDAQRAALQAELALLQGRKDSAKEQANIHGELAELAQKRAGIEAQAARQQIELDTLAAQALQQRVEGYERAALQAQDGLRIAKLDTLEIGKTGAALGALRQARVEDAAAELERQAVTMDGIDLSGNASKALREQAQAMRDVAKVQGYNDAARMVHEYAKAIDEANAATQFELNLSTLSQRDREIALEQYRIAIDLKKRLKEIDASNPADKAGAEKLKAEATEAAARAQAAVVGRVYTREVSRTVDQIDDIFRQGFADMLNRGEDGWKAFTKSLATTFETTVANELYKAFAQPFVVNIIGNLLGLTGGGGVSGAASGGSGVIGMVSNAGSALGMGSMFGAGGLTGSLMAGAGWLTGATTLGGSLSAGASLVGTGTLAGGAAGIGMIVGALAPILLGVAALWGPLFGRKLKDSGIEGTFGGDAGFEGRAYEYYKGGLFRSNKTKYKDLDEEVRQALADTFKSSRSAIGEMGGALGLDTAALDAYKAQVKVSLHGLSPEEAQARMQEELGKIANAMAEQLIGTWREVSVEDLQRQARGGAISSVLRADASGAFDGPQMQYVASEYARAGEQAIDTLTRLATSLTGVNTIFEKLGLIALDASLAGGDLASRLADLMGGMEGLGNAAAAYYQNFYSNDERRDAAKAELDKQMDALGLERIDWDDPNARKKYREIVEREQARMIAEEAAKENTRAAIGTIEGFAYKEGQGFMGADGRVLDRSGLDEYFASQGVAEVDPRLMAIIDSAASGAMSLGELDASIDELIGSSDKAGKSGMETTAALLGLSAAAAEVTMSAEEAAQAAERQAKAEADARKSATDAAWAVLQKSVAAARDAAQAEIDLRQQRLAAAQAVVDIVRDQARDLRGLVDSTVAMTAAQANAWIDGAVSAARGGQLPDAEGLNQAIADARAGMGASAYSNRLDYEAAQLILANKLDEIGDSGAAQVSVDKLLLEQAQMEVDRLDTLIKAEREALDEARGNTAAVRDVATAVRDFRDRLFEETTGSAGGASGAPGAGAGGGEPVEVIGGAEPGGSGRAPRIGEKDANGNYTMQVYLGGHSSYRQTTAAETQHLNEVDRWLDRWRDTGDVAGMLTAAEAEGYRMIDVSTVMGWDYGQLVERARQEGVPRFAAGGLHSGGIRMVGEDGPELEFTGPSRIYNAQQTQRLLAGLGGNADVVAAIKDLQRQGYDIGRTLIVLLQSVETLARKSDAIGVLQREPA